MYWNGRRKIEPLYGAHGDQNAITAALWPNGIGLLPNDVVHSYKYHAMRGLGYGKGYQYAHEQPDALVEHGHLPENLAGHHYYEPKAVGHEATIAKWMAERAAALRARGR